MPLFLKSSSIDLKMKNVTFTNFRKKYECRSSSSLFFTGIIINSLPEKSLDTSNFTFTDVLINNADSSCYLDNYNWLFSINNNLNIQNLTITAFRSSKISIFKFSYNAYCRISNLTIDQLICKLNIHYFIFNLLSRSSMHRCNYQFSCECEHDIERLCIFKYMVFSKRFVFWISQLHYNDFKYLFFRSKYMGRSGYC